MGLRADLRVFFILLLWLIILFYSFETSSARKLILIRKLGSVPVSSSPQGGHNH
ncbi:unnamed protein product [Coffea canephora]|uniref:Uncharacterized protein n=1 Tax=Coffea canephora TaxID=49390 RepID=A0A068TX87_COFCA|nr:unnamed protein product [Coffea canephora]